MSIRNDGRLDPALRIAYRAGIAAWAALALYCVLSLVLGPAGFLSYRRLEASRAEMERNLAVLRETNGRLRVELESLRSDADRAAREARSLGYLREGENAVLLAGRTLERPEHEAGGIVPYTPPLSWPDSALKEIALGVFLAVLAAGLTPRRAKS